MLRIYVAQQSFGLSGEGLEDAIHDSQKLRHVIGVDLAGESAANAKMRLKFATQLPTLSGIALQIIDLARDPDLDMRRLASVLSRDPALTAKVLRVANSPLYGQRRRNSNLRRALMVLGLNATAATHCRKHT